MEGPENVTGLGRVGVETTEQVQKSFNPDPPSVTEIAQF